MLKLTKKADYGLIALRHLAATGKAASAKDIAESYGIPLPLLSKILQRLAKEGLLTSEQGTRGGYRLSREARDISAFEVIRTIDGPLIMTPCLRASASATSARTTCRFQPSAYRGFKSDSRHEAPGVHGLSCHDARGSARV